jgi:hypothetical protein
VTRICARRSREAATSSMALVILAVFLIDLILRRISLSDGMRISGRTRRTRRRFCSRAVRRAPQGYQKTRERARDYREKLN